MSLPIDNIQASIIDRVEHIRENVRQKCSVHIQYMSSSYIFLVLKSFCLFLTVADFVVCKASFCVR